jgi:UPF0271 protein
MAGFDPLSTDEIQYTVPKVKEELGKNPMWQVRFKTAAESGRLRIRTPDKSFVKKVRASAMIVGDRVTLSTADTQVLALALELESHGYCPLILTDDYSIQNVANQMGIQFTSLATHGIRFRLQWIRYCPACHKKYPPSCKSRVCVVCGTELKRKSAGRTAVHRRNATNI